MNLKKIIAALGLCVATGSAFAGGTNATIPVNVSVTNGCIMSAPGQSVDLAFYGPDAHAAYTNNTILSSGSVDATVQCTVGLAWSMAYDQSVHLSATSHDGGLADMHVAFFKDAGMSDFAPKTGVGDGLPQTASLYWKTVLNATSARMVSGALTANQTLSLTW